MARQTKDFDWEGIEREFRANQLTIAEISRRFGVSRKWITVRASEQGWQRDLAAKVQAAFREKIVRSDCGEALGGEVPPDLTDEAIVEGASSRKAEILQCHRRDIANLRRIGLKLSNDLEKLNRDWEKNGDLNLLKQSSVYSNLSNSMQKLVLLERQAFSLDEPQDQEGAGTAAATDAMLSMLAGIARRVEETDMPPEPDEDGEEPDGDDETKP